MMIDIEIPASVFVNIIGYAKSTKATFTVVNPSNLYNPIYGCSGEGFDGREAHIGSVKFISHSDILMNLYSELFPLQYGFVVYTKDIKAVEKMILSNINTIRIIMHVRIIDNAIYDVRNISIINGDEVINLPTFRAGRFYNAYNELLSNTSEFIPDIQLNTDPRFLEINSRVAKEGVFKYMIGNVPIFINNTLLNMNKGDLVFANHTIEPYPRVTIKVVKKKMEIRTVFRVIPII